MIADTRPTAVVHLAAISAVTTASLDPRTAWAVNLNGTLNLTQALVQHAPDCRLLFISSAEVYGLSLNAPEPVTETALLQPVNAYAASKAAADILVRQCAAAGLSAIVARPFNHTGAGQAETFVVPSFAGQIARIEAGMQPPVLRVGDLSDERDFLDVEDVVGAYIDLLEGGSAIRAGSVFNVASGRARRIGDILDALLSMARVDIEVQVDESRLRSSALKRVRGDAARLSQALGWRPSIDFSSTLAEVLESRRAAVSAG